MSSFSIDSKHWNSFGIAGSATALALTYLTLKYNDRVVFDSHRPNTTPLKGWPLVGSTLGLISNMEKINHFFLDAFETTGAKTM
jgi:hypothetical protein